MGKIYTDKQSKQRGLRVESMEKGLNGDKKEKKEIGIPEKEVK
jgi:hypothetical protein